MRDERSTETLAYMTIRHCLISRLLTPDMKRTCQGMKSGGSFALNLYNLAPNAMEAFLPTAKGSALTNRPRLGCTRTTNPIPSSTFNHRVHPSLPFLQSIPTQSTDSPVSEQYSGAGPAGRRELGRHGEGSLRLSWPDRRQTRAAPVPTYLPTKL